MSLTRLDRRFFRSGRDDPAPSVGPSRQMRSIRHVRVVVRSLVRCWPNGLGRTERARTSDYGDLQFTKKIESSNWQSCARTRIYRDLDHRDESSPREILENLKNCRLFGCIRESRIYRDLETIETSRVVEKVSSLEDHENLENCRLLERIRESRMYRDLDDLIAIRP